MTDPRLYPIEVRPLAEEDGGGWQATFPDLPGCMGDGESGVQQTIASRRAGVWIAENREALKSSNAFVEANGLPLAEHRNF